MKHRNTKHINAHVQHALRIASNSIPPQAESTPKSEQISDDNWRRVSEVAFGVEAYAAITGNPVDDDSEGLILGDLLNDLMHWAEFFGYDFNLALARAQRNYAEEATADPYAHARAAHADGELQFLVTTRDAVSAWYDAHPDQTPDYSDPPTHYRRKPKPIVSPRETPFSKDHPAVVLEVIASNVTQDLEVQRSMCQRWEKQWACSSQLRATASRYADIRDMVESYMRHWLRGEIESLRLGRPPQR